MKKANVEGLGRMAAGFLQYRYKLFLMGVKRGEESLNGNSPDYIFYDGACKMIESFGGEWSRRYKGGDNDEDRVNIENYSHIVTFPDDERCKRLNFSAWED